MPAAGLRLRPVRHRRRLRRRARRADRGRGRRAGGAGRGVPLRRHLRDPRLHPEEAPRLRQRLRRRLRGRRGYGWTRRARRASTGRRSIAAKDAEIARLEAAYHDRLRQAGVQLCAARATVARPAPGAARDRGGVYGASHILVATGGAAVRAGHPRRRARHHLERDLRASRRSRSACSIVGGGYVACEFAGIMNGLGTHVIQLYRGDQILRGFDEDLRDHVAGAMRARGVVLEIQRDVDADREGRAAASGSASTTARPTSSTRCCSPPGAAPTPPASGSRRSACGSAPNGAVAVDDWSQTAVPSIFAVGDVTDRDRADAGRDPRGPGLRRHGLRRPAAAVDHTPHPDRDLHPARGGDRSA